VLFVDQFEELWTMSDNDERRRFAQLVASVADDTSIDVRLVFAIRADFFDRPWPTRCWARSSPNRCSPSVP